MNTLFRRAGIVAALFAGILTASAPAQARDRRGDDDAAIAIGAGLAGIAIGAAIASDSRRDRYYDGYYRYDRPRYYRSYPRHYYRDYPRHYYRDDRRHREYRRYKKHRDRHYRRYGW